MNMCDTCEYVLFRYLSLNNLSYLCIGLLSSKEQCYNLHDVKRFDIRIRSTIRALHIRFTYASRSPHIHFTSTALALHTCHDVSSTVSSKFLWQ